MSDEKPAEKSTVKLESPPDWAIALSQKVVDGFVSLNDKVESLSQNVEVLQHDAKDTRQRLGRMERELDVVKGRQDDGSMRVRQESDVNLKQDAAIGMLLEKVDTLAAKTDSQTAILERLETGAKALAKHPKVQAAVWALWTALLAYLASKGWVTR